MFIQAAYLNPGNWGFYYFSFNFISLSVQLYASYEYRFGACSIGCREVYQHNILLAFVTICTHSCLKVHSVHLDQVSIGQIVALVDLSILNEAEVVLHLSI